jgi:hypothetical protein
MDLGQAEYLKDVLGVESWIGAVQAPVQPKAVAVFKETWTAAELSLAEKILTALSAGGGINMRLPSLQAVFDEPDSLAHSHLVIFDSKEAPEKSIQGEQVLWRLGPLKNLLEGTAQEIQQSKREVWNLLKLLREEL